jgi:hypothetical protein
MYGIIGKYLCGPGTKPHCVVTTKEMREKREERENGKSKERKKKLCV